MTLILVSSFIKGLMIFLRLLGGFFVAPFISSKEIPNIARIFLALVTTYMIFFSVPAVQYNPDQGLLPLALLGFNEVITGMIIGFSVTLIFIGISYAGALIGLDIGLSMAQMLDPSTNIENDLIGQVLSIAAITIFLIIDGHHYVIRALVYSYRLVPIGHYAVNQSVLDTLIRLSSGVFILAVKIAAPIMASFFLVNLASGVIVRVIPQIQIMFVAYPLKIGLGFFLLSLVVPVYVFFLRNILSGFEDELLNLLKAMGV